MDEKHDRASESVNKLHVSVVPKNTEDRRRHVTRRPRVMPTTLQMLQHMQRSDAFKQ